MKLLKHGVVFVFHWASFFSCVCVFVVVVAVVAVAVVVVAAVVVAASFCFNKDQQ